VIIYSGLEVSINKGVNNSGASFAHASASSYFLTVPKTWYPFLINLSAYSLPKPLEVPVMTTAAFAALLQCYLGAMIKSNMDV